MDNNFWEEGAKGDFPRRRPSLMVRGETGDLGSWAAPGTCRVRDGSARKTPLAHLRPATPKRKEAEREMFHVKHLFSLIL